MSYDVIVVGAGSVGMAAGYYLAKAGKKTLLIDAHDPPHQFGSHHGDTRIIRYAYGEGAEYVPLVLEAKQRWQELEHASHMRIFTETGVLNIGREGTAFMTATIKSAAEFNLPVEVMTATEINARWPGLKLPFDMMGCYEPTAGVLSCETAISAYRTLAESHGAFLLTNTDVTDLQVHPNGVSVKTANSTFTADALIISAGARSTALLEMVGISLPLTPIRKTFAWFDAEETYYNANHFPAFSFETDNGMFYGFPSMNQSGLKLGRHDGGEAIDPNKPLQPFGTTATDSSDLKQLLQHYFPYTHQLAYGKTCMYTQTPDETFIIDRHPQYAHVAIASGFSGHGFKFSSAVGKAMSDLVISGTTDCDLSPFRIDRFNS